MKVIAQNKKQKKKIVSNLNKENASKFYLKCLESKVFMILRENRDLNEKLLIYFKNTMKIKKKRLYAKSFMKLVKNIIIEREKKVISIKNKMQYLKKVNLL